MTADVWVVRSWWVVNHEEETDVDSVWSSEQAAIDRAALIRDSEDRPMGAEVTQHEVEGVVLG